MTASKKFPWTGALILPTSRPANHAAGVAQLRTIFGYIAPKTKRPSGITDPGAVAPLSNAIRAYNYTKQNRTGKLTPAQARRMRKVSHKQIAA